MRGDRTTASNKNPTNGKAVKIQWKIHPVTEEKYVLRTTRTAELFFIYLFILIRLTTALGPRSRTISTGTRRSDLWLSQGTWHLHPGVSCAADWGRKVCSWCDRRGPFDFCSGVEFRSVNRRRIWRGPTLLNRTQQSTWTRNVIPTFKTNSATCRVQLLTQLNGNAGKRLTRSWLENKYRAESNSTSCNARYDCGGETGAKRVQNWK